MAGQPELRAQHVLRLLLGAPMGGRGLWALKHHQSKPAGATKGGTRDVLACAGAPRMTGRGEVQAQASERESLAGWRLPYVFFNIS